MRIKGRIYSCKNDSRNDVDSYADYYDYNVVRQIDDSDDVDVKTNEFINKYKHFGIWMNDKRTFSFMPDVIDEKIDEFDIDDFSEDFFVLPNGIVEPAYDFLCDRAEETVRYNFELKEIFSIKL